MKEQLRVLLPFAFGALFASAAAQTGVEPVEVAPRGPHRLLLVTTLNPDNCTPSGVLDWSPGPDLPPYMLVVGDAFKVEVKVITRSANVVRWSGLWQWETRHPCGKDECITPRQQPVQSLSGFTLGETAKLTVLAGTTTPVTDSVVIQNYADEPRQLILRREFSQFVKPDNPKPDPRAVLTKSLCAEVLVPKVDIAEVNVSILRRRR
jgi:hypothetical protein